MNELDLFNEIAKNVDEFMEAEIRLNESQISNFKGIEFRITIPFAIIIENLKIISKLNGITLYELYENFNFDQSIKDLSDSIENNKKKK